MQLKNFIFTLRLKNIVNESHFDFNDEIYITINLPPFTATRKVINYTKHICAYKKKMNCLKKKIPLFYLVTCVVVLMCPILHYVHMLMNNSIINIYARRYVFWQIEWVGIKINIKIHLALSTFAARRPPSPRFVRFLAHRSHAEWKKKLFIARAPFYRWK